MPWNNKEGTYTCAESNGLVVFKLKRKLSYRGHVYLEILSQSYDLEIFKRKQSTLLHIHIDINHIPNELKEKTEAYQYNKQNSSLSNKDPYNTLGEEENPLDSYRFNSQETVFVPTFFFPKR